MITVKVAILKAVDMVRDECLVVVGFESLLPFREIIGGCWTVWHDKVRYSEKDMLNIYVTDRSKRGRHEPCYRTHRDSLSH